MKTVLIAPTAFKGTLSPTAVARAIEDGIGMGTSWSGDVKMILAPLADGGDGTIEAVHAAIGGIIREEQVLGAIGTPIYAKWLQIGDEALLELAGACGLAELGSNRDPLGAHTFGLGQLMSRCYEMGIRKMNIGLGGSASTDGGMGMLRALGAVFFDDAGSELEQLGGGALPLIRDCDLMETRWFAKETKLWALTDVDNPLLGERGAAAVFSPQKGASPDQVLQLEDGLRQYADVLEGQTDRLVRDKFGTGAAGGTGFGLACGLGAEISSGFEWIARQIDLESKLNDADIVISGEGRFDSQSLQGKALGRLAQRCKELGKEFWIVAGSAENLPGTADQIFIPKVTDKDSYCSERDITETLSQAVRFHNFFTLGS